MQQVNIHGPDDVRVDEVAEPQPGPRDAVVRVSACGICGSDLSYIRLGGVAGPMGRPMPIGHELSGVVEAVGADVTNLAPGTRVVLNPLGAGNRIGNGSAQGGFAPLLLVPNAADGGCLFPIPEDLSLERAALAEPLGVAMQAVNRAGVAPRERVVVFGAGPIGLAVTAVLRQRGIEDVVVVDFSQRRLAIACELGARVAIRAGDEDVWARVREIHGTARVLGAPMAASDVYIEATGHSPLIGQIVANAGPRARLCVVGLHRTEVPVSFLLVMMKELTLTGSIAYPEDYTESVRMLSQADLGPLITHRFPLSRFAEALAVARDAGAGAKVLVEPG